MNFLKVLFLSLTFVSSVAFANVSGLLSLRQGSQIKDHQLSKILSAPEVLNSRELFSVGEKRQMEKLGLKRLSQVWVLEFSDEQSFIKLERRILQAGLPLLLDWNNLEIKTESSQQNRSPDVFSGFQWGLYNRGLPQTVDLDPVQNYALPARAGIDIELFPEKKNKSDVLVAVLDTGIQMDHPDLKSRIHRNESECRALELFKQCVADNDRKTCEKEWMDLSNPLVDQDKNGYPLDCSGWSLLGGNNAAQIMGRPDFGDDQGHGTHVAGIIGAEVQNGIGVRGVSSSVKILPVQVIGKQPSEPIKPLSVDLTPGEKGKENLNRSLGDLIARGVIYSILSGAKVINFSLGWPQNRDSEYLRTVIQAAMDRGIIIVAAAGNDSTKALLRPCAYPGVLCVAAHGPDGALAHFSNYGGGVEIAAPGLNILSTYPERRRAIRFRSTAGYEFLSGTSQAAPFVAGAAAELLAQGIPANEVIPRLLASAKSLENHMNLLVGTEITGFIPLAPEKELEQKVVSSGRLSVKEAINVSPRPVIHNAVKEKQLISWNLKSNRLLWKIQLKNLWKEFDSTKLDMQVAFLAHHPEAIRPKIDKVSPLVPYAKIWKSGEVREYQIELVITDAAPERSRIPSELEILVRVNLPEIQRNLRFEADVVVAVDENFKTELTQEIPIVSFPRGRSSVLPIDENRDQRPQDRDYFVKVEKKNEWEISLLKYQADRNVYETTGTAKIEITGDSDALREQVLMRADWDFDGVSEYILGLYEDLSDDAKPSPITFYVFDDQMRIKAQFTYDSVVSQIPFSIHWMKYQDRLVPAWVGPGKDPKRKRNLRDRWENPNNRERNELRFYYLDHAGVAQAIEGLGNARIADILEPTFEEKKVGDLPVLLAENKGSVVKPSFIYSFSQAIMRDGLIVDATEVFQADAHHGYRSLLGTRVDRVYSLNFGLDQTVGTYWFSESRSRTQKLNLLDRKDFTWIDENLEAERSQFDSALLVRATFSGTHRKGAFVLTNSEVQYHDLVSKRTARKSLERYTFFADSIFTNLYFPIVLKDSQSLNALLPGIYTTELSGFSRGVKVLVPVFAKDGSLIEMVSPARTRLSSDKGCRPLETPVFLGGEMGYALDYYCENKMIRVPLVY